MPFGFTAQITGVEDLLQSLDALAKPALRNRIKRAALTKAARKIAKKAQSLVPVYGVQKTKMEQENQMTWTPQLTRGLLKKSLGIRAWAGGDVVAVFIGPRRGFRQQIGVRTRGKNIGKPVWQNPIFYAHLVEGGAKHFKGSRFMEKAFYQAKADATEAIREHLQREIDKRF